MSNTIKVLVPEKEEGRLDRFAVSTLSGEKRQEVLFVGNQGIVAEITYFFTKPHLCEEFKRGLSHFGTSVQVLNN